MALITAGNVCQRAAQMTGAYDAMTPLSSADGQLLLDLLNAMLDEWSNYTLACFALLTQSVVLVPGQNQYTIGFNGFINGPRPLKILTDPGTAYVLDGNGNKYPMRVVPEDVWNMYSNTSNIITSNFPNILFYDPQYPLGIINITPFPTLAYTMYWNSTLQLADLPTLSTLISLPPGYILALMSNLAVLSKPFFLDGQMDPVVPATAARTLGAIKRTNQKDIFALFDSEIVARGSLQYNPYSDSVGSVTPAV